MKRAERERRERQVEDDRRAGAERLALKALLDRRIPDSERLVCDMKHPHLLDEFAAHGEGPTGVTHSTGVVRCYARVIAQHVGGGAQAVQQHFTQLIGKERAAELGINLGRLQVTSHPAAGGRTTLDVEFRRQDIAAIAGYLISPDHLNLGSLPPNPFGGPRAAALMDRMKALYHRSRWATENVDEGPTVHQLQYQAEKLAAAVAHEISRAMPSNQARSAALKAMRLDDCLETYLPRVVHRTGWQDILVHDPDPATGRPVPATRKIAVYGISPGKPGSPTRYRIRAGDARHHVCGRLLSFYDA